MSTHDPLYHDLDFEWKQRRNAQQKQSPRAFALRDDLSKLYRKLDLTDSLGGSVLTALDLLSLALSEGKDIDAPEEQTLRETFGLLR